MQQPSDSPLSAASVDAFQTHFGGAPQLAVYSPGRVNIIGDHTDYCDGFAMPMAINRHTVALAAPGAVEGQIRIYSRALDATLQLSVTAAWQREGDWGDYIRGVLAGYAARGAQLVPMDVLIDGDLPQGAGLSSSASMEFAMALVVEHYLDLQLLPLERIKLCQTAENEFAGMPCGILDQFSVGMAQAGHAMLLDCRATRAEQVALPEMLAFAVLDSGVRHQLTDGGYATRFAQAREAESLLGRSLRDCTFDDLPVLTDPIIQQRARHIISENARVLDFARALAASEWAYAGELMSASHHSLRDDYAVSCPEVDDLVERAMAAGALGARMTGGGFGGSVIAMVPVSQRESFEHALQADAPPLWVAASAAAHQVVLNGDATAMAAGSEAS